MQYGATCRAWLKRGDALHPALTRGPPRSLPGMPCGVAPLRIRLTTYPASWCEHGAARATRTLAAALHLRCAVLADGSEPTWAFLDLDFDVSLICAVRGACGDDSPLVVDRPSLQVRQPPLVSTPAQQAARQAMCSVCFALLESIETLVHRAHSHVALRVHLASSAPCLQIWKFRELNSQLATAATCALQVETSFFKKRKNAQN